MSPSPPTQPEMTPQLSLVMPCYNEEEIVAYTINRLLSAFERAGYDLQLVAVDNGSSDRTGEILRDFAAKSRSVVHLTVPVNQGYGFGVLSGIPHCTAPWIGFIPADGQVDAEDVVHLYEAVAASTGPVLAKVRRRFRMDGLARKVVSTGYNLFMLMLWPRLGSLDVNGVPKILPRDVLLDMELRSRNWLLDPEIMVKASHLGVRVLEFNVFARMRGGGLSHVRASTCWEFLTNLFRMRFSGELERWASQLSAAKRARNGTNPSTVASVESPAGALADRGAR
jgi:glycosyltransferase involved in cell wall biosynthesis